MSQAVDQYATNADVVKVPTGDAFPAGTFRPSDVCDSVVLQFPLTTNSTPFTRVDDYTKLDEAKLKAALLQAGTARW